MLKHRSTPHPWLIEFAVDFAAIVGAYYLTFEVTRYRSEGELVTLRLLSLACDDAQEMKDEPVLLVNGREIWDGDMRSGDTRTLDLITEFRTEAQIALWERDRIAQALTYNQAVEA